MRRDSHPARYRRRGVEHHVRGGDHGVVHVHRVGDVVRIGVVQRGRTERYAREDVGKVPVGGGVINAAGLFVVTQPAAGQFKAFSAVCTHMGCTVTKVVDGKIDCPCHQSQFDITTGAPTSASQAKSPLPAKTATVSGDSVYIA